MKGVLPMRTLPYDEAVLSRLLDLWLPPIANAPTGAQIEALTPTQLPMSREHVDEEGTDG
jgi:hypothetical protein